MPLSVVGQKPVDWSGKKRQVRAELFNAVTGVAIRDSLYAEILLPDSTVVASTFNVFNPRYEYANEDEYRYYINFNSVDAKGEEFLLRVSHPDYATTYLPIKLSTFDTDLGPLSVRKLNSYERKHRQLGEVTVTASIIQVVNKGDTIQYNADAFALAQGSMLDALIEQLPGVELRENGQLYVNGRFIDKLLLDGKDFFKGDQFVLLQNLPAYAVKDVQVYEKASITQEVFGFESPDDPNLYVMDVHLKKSYNNGWIANAEVSGGTHDRYRIRAFGLGYNKNVRVAAYGLMNNLNETRNPGRSGNWQPSNQTNGITTTKGGGMDYGVFSSDKSFELTGSASGRHTGTSLNTLTNIQTFLDGGDNYTRRWKDQKNTATDIKTEHSLTLRPKEGHSYQHVFDFSAELENGKVSVDNTEGTFGKSIGNRPTLRDELEIGMPDEMDVINRYIQTIQQGNREFGLSFGSMHALSLFGTLQGLQLYTQVLYRHITPRYPDFNNYLVQYAGSPSVVSSCSNPIRDHGYNYMIGGSLIKQLTSELLFIPRIDYFQAYIFKGNDWLTDELSDSTIRSNDVRLPSMKDDMLMRLDPRNSYTTGEHIYYLRPRITLSYRKTYLRDGKEFLTVNPSITAEARFVRRQMSFRGIDDQNVALNAAVPTVNVGLQFSTVGSPQDLMLTYKLSGREADLFNKINVMFDYDPLNIRIGNPALKNSLNHSFELLYYNSDWMFDRLKMWLSFNYNIFDNQTAMSYAYDRSTGIKTFKPINIDGNRSGNIMVGPTIALDRDKKFTFVDYVTIEPSRSVDMISYDNFLSSEKNIVNTLYFSQSGTLKYSVKRFTAAIEGRYESRHVTSPLQKFNSFTIKNYRYGVSGRVLLPADFELSSDIMMYSTRGYDYHEMNTNQLVWNARMSKSLMKGSLIVAVDGYDILGNVKSIFYNISEQGRTETWVNSIPSYVMLSLRWNFSKKPRE